MYSSSRTSYWRPTPEDLSRVQFTMLYSPLYVKVLFHFDWYSESQTRKKGAPQILRSADTVKQQLLYDQHLSDIHSEDSSAKMNFMRNTSLSQHAVGERLECTI